MNVHRLRGMLMANILIGLDEGKDMSIPWDTIEYCRTGRGFARHLYHRFIESAQKAALINGRRFYLQ